MKSLKDFRPAIECDECYKIILMGDMPSILETCIDCIKEKEMFENMDIAERLEEVVHWVIEDLWQELSKESKSRVIRQLRFMDYSVDDLEEEA
mgnify:FL=1